MSKFYYLKKVEDHKYGFAYAKDFETDGVLNDIEITRCVDFANGLRIDVTKQKMLKIRCAMRLLHGKDGLEKEKKVFIL